MSPHFITHQSATHTLQTEPVDLQNSTSRNSSTVPVPSRLPAYFIPLTKTAIESVEKFVIFIGYPRSGHSIVGSFMDSHPNMIIAHEYPLFMTLLQRRMSKGEIFNVLYKKSYDELITGWRGKMNIKNKGYSLAMDGLWQATFDHLKVIGNKHGGAMVQLYRKHPQAFLGAMSYLKAAVKVPIHVIHVVRNPFDMIATQALYVKTGTPGVRINASEQDKMNDTKFLTTIAMDMLARVNAAAKLIDVLHVPTLQIRSEDLIRDPVRVMKSICTFVGVSSPEYYLKACQARTYSSSSKSRNTVVWPQSLIDTLHERLIDRPYFQHYSFF